MGSVVTINSIPNSQVIEAPSAPSIAWKVTQGVATGLLLIGIAAGSGTLLAIGVPRLLASPSAKWVWQAAIVPGAEQIGQAVGQACSSVSRWVCASQWAWNALAFPVAEKIVLSMRDKAIKSTAVAILGAAGAMLSAVGRTALAASRALVQFSADTCVQIGSVFQCSKQPLRS